MKAMTMIAHAVKLYRSTFADYARIVYNVPIIPKRPQIWWQAGVGWRVDGKIELGTAPEIVNRYQAKANKLAEEIKDYVGRPLEPGRTPKRGNEVKPDERSGASQERLDEVERQP